jgi:hypothetical protein
MAKRRFEFSYEVDEGNKTSPNNSASWKEAINLIGGMASIVSLGWVVFHYLLS